MAKLHGRTSYSQSLYVKKFTDWFIQCSDANIFSIWYNLSIFLPLNPAIYRIGTHQISNILCTRCKEQNESHYDFTFYCKLFEITPDYIGEVI